MSSILRRTVLLVIAALVVWRIAALGLSLHAARQLRDGDAAAADRALAWDGNQPDALLAQAFAKSQQDPETAARLFGRAYAENPADARPLIAMAELVQPQGEQTRADDLVNAALGLMPADPRTQRQAANYWASRDDLTQAMRHWSLALEADPQTRNTVFPMLLALAEDPRTRGAFQPFAAEPPTWWEPFFAEVAKRALDVEPVRILFSMRRESARVPITEEERQTYVARLTKEGMISEAYIEWVNSLNPAQRAQLGLLHNGGFEVEPTNWGFDWHVRSTPDALVDRAHTYGIDGDKALHLLFDHREKGFSGVDQPLFLDPGAYRLTGRVRTDNIESQGGLKWSLRCLLPKAQDLGESERFLGSNEWRDFGFAFQVPDTCRLEEVRLVSAGKRPFENSINGGAWFDRMAIRKLPAPAPIPDAHEQPASRATAPTADAEHPTTPAE